MQVLLEDCKFVLEAPGIEALVGAVAHSLALVRVAYKQVWLAPWVVDTLAFVAVEAHTPAQELEVVGRYELVDVQHRLCVVLELQPHMKVYWLVHCKMVLLMVLVHYRSV